MEDLRIVKEAYQTYFEKGMKALGENDYEQAKRYIQDAAKAMLKLAEGASGELKKQRFNRAKDLQDMAIKISDKTKYKKERVDVNNIKKGSKNNSSNNAEADSDCTVFVPVGKTDITLDDVAGLDDVKEEIKNSVINAQKYKEIYKLYGAKSGGGILLYGLPGTGKTMIAQAIANDLNAAFYSIKCSDIMSKWFGQAEQNIRNLFTEAKKNPVSVIFFDEFEAIGTKRDTNSTVMKRVVPELLEQIQGFENSKSDNILLIIAATNRPWDIDSGILRNGRIGTFIYVPLPDAEAREAIVRNNFKNAPTEDLDYEKIVNRTEGFSGADISAFCNNVKKNVTCKLVKMIEDNKICINQVSITNNLPITQVDVDEVLDISKSTVQQKDLEKIEKYREQINN